MNTKSEVTEFDLRRPEFQDPRLTPDMFEFDATGEVVRKDRFEQGIRKILGMFIERGIFSPRDQWVTGDVVAAVKTIMENFDRLKDLIDIVNFAPHDAQFYHFDNQEYIKNIDQEHLKNAQNNSGEGLINFDSCKKDNDWEGTSAWIDYIDVLVSMSERPILFSTDMVRAILEGRKTQTRRVVKNELIIEQAEFECGNRPHVTLSEPSLQYWVDNRCPFGQVGDRLWVRETFRFYDSDECPHADFPCGCPRHGTPLYKASHDCGDGEKWKPSIHMPRWASRILLEITNIRVMRLNDISEEDAKAEGGPRNHPSIDKVSRTLGFKDWSRSWFAQTWESINGTDSWNKNPWVWVIEFKVIQGGAV